MDGTRRRQQPSRTRELNWICDSGHVWNAVVYSRSRGKGCPICSGRHVLAGYNDLATINPELATQAHGWDPTTVTAGSRNDVDWICKEDHVWNATVRNRSSGSNCPFCSGKKVLAGYNDLATINPELATQAHGWDPTTATTKSGKKVDWICEEGHVWPAQICKRSDGSNCPICFGHQVLDGFNDLAFKNPDLAKQAHGWDATTVTSKSKRIREWQCDFGHVWKAVVSDRSKGSNCPICAEYSFNPSKPAWMYLVKDDVRDLLKIGITNFIEQRLQTHARGGFEVIDIVGPIEIGKVVQTWERQILEYLRTHGAIAAKDSGAAKFDGYTESWRRDSFPIASIAEIQELVSAGLARD